jgi:subtilase family serine protease
MKHPVSGTRTARRVVAVAFVGALTVGGQAAVTASASASRPAQPAMRLARMAPRIPVGVHFVGALAPTTRLDLSVALWPRSEKALATFIDETSIPGGRFFHHYLKAGQFASRFGPTAATLGAVESQVRSLGLGTPRLSRDHLFVSFEATTGRVERAFHLLLGRYRLPTGRVGFINEQTPLVSGALASKAVIGILGMDSLSTPRPLLVHSMRRIHVATFRGTERIKHTTAPVACSGANKAAQNSGSYTDPQIAKAYQLSTLYGKSAFGAGQTIAVYELEPFSMNDITPFQRCYGTTVKVTNHNEYGGAGTGTGSGESELDIENIIGLAPGATIQVYTGPGNATDAQSVGVYDAMVTPDAARQLSTSWGLCERDEGTSLIQAEEPVFEEAAAQGQTLYAAAGDDGSEDCLQDGTSNPGILNVDDPGSDPYVVSVGGLTLRSDTAPPKEKVWNDGTSKYGDGTGDGAGGGGISRVWKRPPWQTGPNVINSFSTKDGCGKVTSAYCREVPDVSGDADPDIGGWVIYYRGQWQGGEGGTSAAAPLWAATTAVINSQCASRRGAVGFDAPSLYWVASHPGNVPNFTDVTVGSNDYTGNHGGDYPAAKGYDMASGLGSPLAAGLATSLC